MPAAEVLHGVRGPGGRGAALQLQSGHRGLPGPEYHGQREDRNLELGRSPEPGGILAILA